MMRAAGSAAGVAGRGWRAVAAACAHGCTRARPLRRVPMTLARGGGARSLSGLRTNTAPPMEAMDLHIRSMRPSATLAINEASARLVAEGKSVYKFGLGQSPFPVPQPMVDALQAHAAEKDYIAVAGLPQLREAVAGWCNRVVGGREHTADSMCVQVQCTPHGRSVYEPRLTPPPRLPLPHVCACVLRVCSVIGPGSKELLFLTQLVYSGELLLPQGSWVSYQPQARILRRPVTWLPCTMEGESPPRRHAVTSSRRRGVAWAWGAGHAR